MLPEFLRELVASVFGAVLLVFGVVDLGSLVEDLLNFLAELFAGAIGFKGGVALTR